MPVKSLVDLASKACIKNSRDLRDVGSFEYWKISRVLSRIDSPEQLREIETHSPQIKGEDVELWRAFIARDIPNWQTKNYAPKNPEKWYEVYKRYKREQREEIERDEAVLRETMMGLRKAREQNVSKVVDLKTLPKVPKDPRMLANNCGVPIGRNKNGGRPGAPSSLTWTAGSKTKMTDGKSVLTRARREAKEISAMSKLTKPTHELRGRISQVTRAPAGMVKEYKTATQPAVKILSRRTNTVRKTDGGISKPSLEDREKRLRALTSGGAGSKRDASGAAKETLVGSSDEGEDDEDLGDLFDDAPKPQSRPPKPLSSASASRPGPSSPLSSSLASSSKASPSGSSRPQPASRAVTEPRPSELISSLISKPKPAPKAMPRPTDRSPPAVGSSPPKPDSRSGSPMAGAPKRPMMAPRKEVDIFNRGSKKPRVR